jgi:hypothetical protein
MVYYIVPEGTAVQYLVHRLEPNCLAFNSQLHYKHEPNNTILLSFGFLPHLEIIIYGLCEY